jgi:hypothetical protein
MRPPVDLTKLHPGVKVRLRGDAKPQPRKPYPRGWQEVAEINWTAAEAARLVVSQHFRVTSDHRWLPVELIEEIVI